MTVEHRLKGIRQPCDGGASSNWASWHDRCCPPVDTVETTVRAAKPQAIQKRHTEVLLERKT